MIHALRYFCCRITIQQQKAFSPQTKVTSLISILKTLQDIILNLVSQLLSLVLVVKLNNTNVFQS
jgi:hypothetical protein